MSGQIYSHSGTKLEISTVKQNSDLDEDAFELLTFTNIGNIGNVGEYGISTNMLTYDTMDTLVSRKAKGVTNAGDPTIECARDSTDAGQLAMNAAGLPSNFDSYAFKHTKQDGSVYYLRGLVSGPVHPGGGNEDFDVSVYTLALNQAPVAVLAP